MMMPASFPLLTKAVQIYCLYNESRTLIPLGDDNKDNYKTALNRNMKNLGPPAREYTNGSNDLFERTHSVNSAFNRIIIYSGNVLHAADIDVSLFNGNDNSQWRLTVTSLINSTFPP
jgi:Family of unknown function (DUF6445)